MVGILFLEDSSYSLHSHFQTYPRGSRTFPPWGKVAIARSYLALSTWATDIWSDSIIDKRSRNMLHFFFNTIILQLPWSERAYTICVAKTESWQIQERGTSCAHSRRVQCWAQCPIRCSNCLLSEAIARSLNTNSSVTESAPIYPPSNLK
jgi:hypothetical protein